MRLRRSPKTIVADYDWAWLLVLPTAGQRERGAPIVQAIHAGLARLFPRSQTEALERLWSAAFRESGKEIANAITNEAPSADVPPERVERPATEPRGALVSSPT